MITVPLQDYISGFGAMVILWKGIECIYTQPLSFSRRRYEEMLIPFEKHTIVVGKTQSGKTYGTMKSLSGVNKGVLFFNVQHVTDNMQGFTRADNSNTWEQIEKLLKAKRKINYVPSTELDEAQTEIQYIIKKLYDGSFKDIFLVVDECHLLSMDATTKKQLIRVATTGLRFGIYAIFISQRLALVDNTLMTQSNKIVFYKSNLEGNYLKNYNIPDEAINDRLRKGGQYSYVTYDFDELKGAYKV